MGVVQTCCMEQNWLRAHNWSLDLSWQTFKSQASYRLLPANGWEWQRQKGPLPVSSRNSPMGYFGLRNFHQPGKTFLLLGNKVYISHIIIFPYPFHVLHRNQTLQSEGSLSFFFMLPHLLSFTDIFPTYLLEIESHLYVCFSDNPNKHKSTVHFRRNHQWN